MPPPFHQERRDAGPQLCWQPPTTQLSPDALRAHVLKHGVGGAGIGAGAAPPPQQPQALC